MTTNDTAAHWVRTARAIGVATAALAALGLAGCETGGNLLGGGSSTPPSAAITPPVAQAPQPQATVKVAIAPVIGPPESVSKALVAQVAGSAERQRVAIAGPGDQATFTLRGFFVAPTKDKSSNKLSYIWDVTDSANKRVNRITGEETLAAQTGNDPWTAVTPQVMQTIADKTAASIAAWLPTQAPGAASAAPAVAQAAPTVPVATSNTTTGSIPGAIMAVVPKVTGAPGDGNTSLAAAMRKELEEKGFQFSDAAQGAYRVVADVKIKPPKDGSQAIAINWTINDPKGQEVAKISQNNDVPAGYLDKSWGQSAEDAAKAASVQIRQVIADHRSGKQIQSSGLPAGSKVN